MHYSVIKDITELFKEFESENSENYYTSDFKGLKKWIVDKKYNKNQDVSEIYWNGNENVITSESALSTFLTHLKEFEIMYFKLVLTDSEFSTSEEFLYLIDLKFFGKMTAAELIKKNIHDEFSGMLIISSLFNKGLIQYVNHEDHDNLTIKISSNGDKILTKQIQKMTEATNILIGNLDQKEKNEFINIINKLNNFHNDLFSGMDINDLLNIENLKFFLKNKLSQK